MALTIREQLIRKLVARVQTLTTVEVKRAQRSQGEGQEKFISVWDGDDKELESSYGSEKNEFPILVITEWNTGDENPSIAVNAYIGELVAAVMGADHNLDGMADRISRASTSPTYPNDGSNIATLSMMFAVTYTTKKGDPYTQF